MAAGVGRTLQVLTGSAHWHGKLLLLFVVSFTLACRIYLRRMQQCLPMKPNRWFSQWRCLMCRIVKFTFSLLYWCIWCSLSHTHVTHTHVTHTHTHCNIFPWFVSYADLFVCSSLTPLPFALFLLFPSWPPGRKMDSIMKTSLGWPSRLLRWPNEWEQQQRSEFSRTLYSIVTGTTLCAQGNSSTHWGNDCLCAKPDLHGKVHA